jgi:hypothetical protein
MAAPLHVVLDLTDPDVVGVLNDVIVALRSHVMATGTAVTATVAAPEGWHPLTMTAMPGGHVVLGVRYAGLTKSRTNNVAEALDRRGWQLDEDGEGATHRHPPGTDAMTVAFEVQSMVLAAGAPRTPRRVTAVDAGGSPVPVGLELRLQAEPEA